MESLGSDRPHGTTCQVPGGPGPVPLTKVIGVCDKDEDDGIKDEVNDGVNDMYKDEVN